MKIDLIDVIQDALISGTNGDNYEKAKFIEFLREALRDIDDEKRTK